MQVRLGLVCAALLVAVLVGGTTPMEAAPPTRVAAWSLADGSLTPERAAGLRTVGDGLALSGGQMEGSWTSAPLAARFEFIALGAVWAEALPPGVAATLAVRTSDDGHLWGAWAELPIEGDHAPDGRPASGSDLLFVRGHYAQVRLTVRGASGAAPLFTGLRLVALDSRHGPTATESAGGGVAVAPGDPTIISRAGWGADERLRYDSSGAEIWPHSYRRPEIFFVHHTAGSNSVPDGAAAVRAVYYFHAVERGWGDIGYNFVVDPQGNVYEGRHGGERGESIVVGGHTYGLNAGSMGVALLGDFTSYPLPPAAEDALVRLLAARANQWSIHPLQSRSFMGVSWSSGVMGHRDGGAVTGRTTTCPGDQLYTRLPTIRQRVWDQLLTLEPWLWLDPLPDPLPGQQSFPVAASLGTTQIDLYVDGVYWGTDPTAPFTIILTPAGQRPGSHTARVVARTGTGRTATIERTFTVAQPTATPTRTPPPTPTATATPTPTPSPTATPTFPPTATIVPLRPRLWLPLIQRQP